MKLTISKKDFFQALLHSAEVVERRTTVPILSHLLLEASKEGALTITSTDLELSVRETITAQVTTPGAITVSAYMLREIVRKFSDDDVISLTLLEDSNHLLLESKLSRFELSTLSAIDFPAIQNAEFPHRFTISCLQLQKLIEGTKFAMSEEDTRYFLNGIFMHAANEGRELRMVATDGHRLARVYTPLPKGAEHIPAVILSRKTVNEISSILKDLAETEMIEIGLSDTLLRFQVKGIVLISRLIDGIFPDYERFTPVGHDKSLLVSVADFARAVDRVALLAQEKTRGIKLFIDKGVIKFSVEGSEYGAANDEVAVDYNATPMNLDFNANYLLDVANVMKPEAEAEILMGHDDMAVIIRQHQDPEAMYVIMPMKV
jgi:DNA polymerase-3 subunit beta